MEYRRSNSSDGIMYRYQRGCTEGLRKYNITFMHTKHAIFGLSSMVELYQPYGSSEPFVYSFLKA